MLLISLNFCSTFGSLCRVHRSFCCQAVEKGEKQERDWPAVVTQLELLGRAVYELGRGDCKARFPMKFAGGLPFSLGETCGCADCCGFCVGALANLSHLETVQRVYFCLLLQPEGVWIFVCACVVLSPALQWFSKLSKW